MKYVNTLNMSLYKNEWFALENEDMNPMLYARLVNSLEKIFIKEYGITGAKEHVSKIQRDNRLVLFINQKKVPNIIKSLVQNPEMPIQVSLKGRTNDGREVTRMIDKPFNANSCTELIPYYNKSSKR